jgi:uncharacterized protein YndB with AHSA1/START domain
MKTMGRFSITPVGETDIVMKRSFKAPRHLIFDAFTKPELIQQWLLGPDGWTMPVCEVDLRPGGRYRYVWRKDNTDMGLSGTFREIVTHEKLVHTEQFDQPWYPGECIITTEFTEQNGETIVTQTMHMSSKEARDGVLKTGMEKGVARSYDRLEEVLGIAH